MSNPTTKIKTAQTTEDQIEDSTLTFKCNNTGKYIQIDIKEKEDGRADIEITFEPNLDGMDEKAIYSNAASKVFEYLTE